MKVPEAICSFWARFQETVAFDASTRFYEAFHFDDNERSANALAELVLDAKESPTFKDSVRLTIPASTSILDL